MTSNVGSDLWRRDRGSVGFGAREEDAGPMAIPTTQEVRERLAKTFRPEFLNRVDELVLFSPLGDDELAGITRLQLDALFDRVRERGIDVIVTDEGVREVARRGHDPAQGARPIERAVEDHVARPLSAMILGGEAKPGQTIRIDARDGMIELRVVDPAGEAAT
jgi:ATP-dependent Clp protease ATP-binding subunit ClpA